MTYLFKDSEQAARRLRLVAQVFSDSSRPFLQEFASSAPAVAIDLGCGPGYTTRLLAEITGCTRAIGLDSSESFLAQARRDAPAHIAFICHDVTQIPFPGGAGDLIYCRLLLTHLRNPPAMIDLWSTQLNPHGRLLLEEVEWIQTEHPILQQYLDIQAALLRQQGNELYIGPLLDRQATGNGLRRRLSRAYSLDVSTTQAATMFSLNLPSWKHHPFIQEKYSTSIDQLEQDLRALATTATHEGKNNWGIRQLAYERE